VVIVDQRPTSVASHYVGHWLQRTYTETDPIYAVTGYAGEEVCDILQVQRPIRREYRFPAGGTMHLTRAWQ